MGKSEINKEASLSVIFEKMFWTILLEANAHQVILIMESLAGESSASEYPALKQGKSKATHLLFHMLADKTVLFCNPTLQNPPNEDYSSSKNQKFYQKD